MSAVLEALTLYPTLALISAAILGLLVGSFLNVVVYRLPKMMQTEWRTQCCELLEQPRPEQTRFNLITPNSTCPHCGHGIRAWENIPVVSYLFLRGRCSACRAPISRRYPIVELVTGLLSVFVIHHFGVTFEGAVALAFTWALIALTLIDADTQLLPDAITLPLLWLGLIVNHLGGFATLESALWGAVAGYLSLWSIYWAFKLLTGKEGMGYGDFKLLAALGAWLGWQLLPVVILLSSLVGAVIGLGLVLMRGRGRNVPMPFGPYLAIAGWIAFIWGDAIVRTYLQFALP
ncbi:prepilin peptidase [Marinimicrobium sp. ARAG 43.8]|uniref:prepilin peptidase n=1 Tax=Marinimicrobium sp. ARAG 43.8 TaxID=3418719 RepID=UPI003CF95DEA